MSRRSFKARSPWRDQFQSPTADSLFGALNKEHLEVARYAREVLLECFPGVEGIAWYGVPWRWTVLYRPAAAERTWAYLVPRPDRPLLVLPVHVEVLRQLPPRTPKFIRDRLPVAPRAGDLFWPEWELSGSGQIDELLKLLRPACAGSLATVA